MVLGQFGRLPVIQYIEYIVLKYIKYIGQLVPFRRAVLSAGSDKRHHSPGSQQLVVRQNEERAKGRGSQGVVMESPRDSE